MNKKDIEQCIKNNSIVRIYYFEEEIYGHILINSKKFLVVLEMLDFTYQGLIIFNKKYIKKIKHSKNEKFSGKLMSKYVKKPQKDISWLNLKTFRTLLHSLKKYHNELCIGFAEDVDIILVGNIVKFDNKYLFFRTIDTEARYNKKVSKVAIRDISKLAFDNSYVNLLFRYNKDIHYPYR